MSGHTIDIISCIDRIQCFSDYVNVSPELIIDNDVDLSNFKLIADNEKIYPQNMSTKGCQLFERGYAADTNLEICAKLANKGTGVQILSDALNIPTSDMAAVGDAAADISMLKAVKFGVAFSYPRLKPWD